MERFRKFGRIRFLATAVVHSPSGGNRFEAHVTTLSRGGLGLFSQGFVEVGHAVDLELTWTGQQGQVFRDRVQGVVVNAQVDIDGNTLGVQFTEPLGPKNHALLELIQKAQETEE